MNCHLCAGIKHKVLLRRLLATFFDRYECGYRDIAPGPAVSEGVFTCVPDMIGLNSSRFVLFGNSLADAFMQRKVQVDSRYRFIHESIGVWPFFAHGCLKHGM